MRYSHWRRAVVAPLLSLFAVGAALANAPAPVDPVAVFKANCSQCHEHPETKAPPVENLRRLPAQKIWQAMEFGIMQPMAGNLTSEERLQLAKWLAAEEDAKRNAWLQARACPSETPAPLTGEENWGMGRNNGRNPGGVRIHAGNVDRLELQWSIALPAVNSMRSLPVVTANTVYLGGQDARLLALDRASGCVRWSLDVNSAVRTALTLERTPDGINTLFFADELGTVYAVDAVKGVVRWKKPVKTHPTSIISGSPAYHDGRLFVPISLFEELVAANPKYECCRAHGGIVALDAQTGEQAWYFGTTKEAEPVGVSAAGTAMFGPSGAAVWSRPTVDVRRGVIYIGTGDNVSLPATANSDSIIAVEMATGKPRWVFQALARDAWNLACMFEGPNCPQDSGPDFDFGASPILVTDAKGAGKGDLILAGQKSGEVFALDPDNGGAPVWRRHLAPDPSQVGANGGIHHGMASDGRIVLVPISTVAKSSSIDASRPSVHAISVHGGKLAWSHEFSRGCAVDPADIPGDLGGTSDQGAKRSPWPACSFFFAPSAPPTLAGGLAYVPTLDGKVHILDAATGKELRILETNRPFATSNGVEGHGGAIDAGGVLVNGDQVIVGSGYSMFGQIPGNVLLVYGLKRAP